MECRKLEITVVSAHNLPDVRSLGLMKVYAKVSLEGASVKTPVDMEGDTNPTWNFAVDYTVSESTIQRHGVNLVVKLKCKRTLGDRFVGEVKILMKVTAMKTMTQNLVLKCMMATFFYDAS